jgi:hypothetical protein
MQKRKLGFFSLAFDTTTTTTGTAGSPPPPRPCAQVHPSKKMSAGASIFFQRINS